ncbi:MAG: TIGR02147 family protein, partial [Chitinivibrionales bacterium]|nr:TIGR02147 family protein [Chitinivibrionales bacterium]
KKSNSFFSYRFLSRKIGLDASSLLKVMHRQMHVSGKIAPKIVAYLKLNEKEAVYFKALLLFNKAKNSKEIEKYFKQIMELNFQQVKHIGENYRIFYSQWYYKAIYMLLAMCPCNGNPSELAVKLVPAVTEAEIQKAILLLEQYGFIQKQTDGSYRTLYKIVSADNALFKAQENEIYEKQVSQLGVEAFDRFTHEERRTDSFCVRLSENGHREMMQLLDTFKTEILRICSTDSKCTRIYQINTHLFPLSVPMEPMP